MTTPHDELRFIRLWFEGATERLLDTPCVNCPIPENFISDVDKARNALAKWLVAARANNDFSQQEREGDDGK